ncbi:MAG: ABC transporter permease [Pseudomonadota bacterium]
MREMDVNRPVRGLELQPLAAAKDIIDGALAWRVWISLSWQEFSSMYRRSLIGVSWVMLSFAAFVFVKITIFSSLLAVDDATYYDAYLVVGFYLWVYLSQSIIASPDVFFSASGWIKSEPLALSTYVYKSAMREIYNLLFITMVVFAALFYLGRDYSVTALWSIPALLFLFVNTFFFKLLVGIVGARFRDLAHLIRAVMLPMLFMTPIFWLPSQMPSLMKYLWWNPLFHALEIFRAPLLDNRIPYESWAFMAVQFCIVSLVAFLLFSRFRQRIVFWF